MSPRQPLADPSTGLGVLMFDGASRREAVEYATLGPEHEDCLRVDRAPMRFPRRARSIRWRPTDGRLAPCGN